MENLNQMFWDSKFRILTLVFIIISVIFISGCSQQNWEIQGESIIQDDANIYLEITPHTITSSRWVEAEFESKVFEGDIDFVFGFDTTQAKPISSQLYNPKNVTYNYTCEYNFDYTQDPNYFWCYEVINDVNGTHNLTHFEHEFDGGDIGEGYAWWNKWEEWQDWNPTTKINYDYADMNIWYYAKNQHVNAGQTYKIRYYLNVPSGSSGKYTLAMKPSSESIQEAIANDHFYMLDPWWDTDPNNLNDSLIVYYTFEEALNDSKNHRNATCGNCPTFESTGKIGFGLLYDGAGDEAKISQGGNLFGNSANWSIMFWQKTQANPGSAWPLFGFDAALDIKGYQADASNAGDLVISAVGGAGSCAYDTNTEIDNNVWRHIIVVWNESDSRLAAYIDGVYIGSCNVDIGNINSSNDFGIGDGIGFGLNFDGYIDEFGIWNRILNSSDITALFNASNGFGFSHFDNGASASTDPSILFQEPTEEANATKSQDLVQINVSVDFKGQAEENITFFLYNNTGSQLGSTNFTNSTRYYEFLGLSDAEYYYNVTAFNNLGGSGSTETRNIFLDTAGGPILTLIEGNGSTVTESLPVDILFNFSAVDLTLNSCWYRTSDNETNVSTTCNQRFNITFFTAGNKTIIYNANDSVENDVSDNTTNFIYTFAYQQDAQPDPIIEGAQNNVTLCIDFSTDLPTTTAILNWSNENYNLDLTTIVNDTRTCFESGFTVPTGTGATTGLAQNFSWTFNISGITTNTVTNISNQTVYKLEMDDCTTFNNTVLNYTLFDEENKTLIPIGLNPRIEIAVTLESIINSSIAFNFSTNQTGVNTLGVCIPNGTVDFLNHRLDAVTLYESDEHATEYYYLDNFTLSNRSFIPQNISLFDLNLGDSTEFRLTFTGSDYLPVEGALVFLDRQYIGENVFETVELPRTDANGQTILHMVRNDVVYNIRVMKNGVVLGNFENIRAFCDDFTIGDCTINLNGVEGVEEVFDYDEETGITFTQPVFNSTLNTISFTFTSIDGTSKDVSMEVLVNDVFGNRTLCRNSLNAISGALSCEIDSDINDASVGTIISVGDSQIAMMFVTLDPTNYGVAGYLVAFVILLSTILMFMGSKTGVLIGILLGVAASFGLGLLTGNLIGYGASGLWLIIVVIIGIWKLNKERVQ